MEREYSEKEPQGDGERWAKSSREVLQEAGIDVTDSDIAAALEEISISDPEEATQLVMDLMGNAGLEPDEAFMQVVERGGGEVEQVLPNASEKIAAIAGAALDALGVRAPGELEAIAKRSGHGALGTAAELLVQKGVCATTDDAMLIIDPDGSLEAEVSA